MLDAEGAEIVGPGRDLAEGLRLARGSDISAALLDVRIGRETVAPQPRSRFDHPLSSRFEEMDCIAIFEDVLVPWERVFVDGRPGSREIVNALGLDRSALTGVQVEARMLSQWLEPLVTSAGTVCAYVPVGAEPGSIEMLDILLRRSGRVLLPVARTTRDDMPLPLRWGEYRPGALVRGPWGLLEPAEPVLPESALGEADLVIVPALAVDRRGVRLGRGRGFYDR